MFSAITFPISISVWTYYVHHAYYVASPLRPSSFGHCNNIRWKEQTVKLLIMLNFPKLLLHFCRAFTRFPQYSHRGGLVSIPS